MTKHYVICWVALLAIIGAMFWVATEAHSDTSYVTTEKVGVEICFPRETWNPPASSPVTEDDRPCDILNRPEEDGSSRLYLGTLANDRAECVIPNPAEERGEFVIHCHRVSR